MSADLTTTGPAGTTGPTGTTATTATTATTGGPGSPADPVRDAASAVAATSGRGGRSAVVVIAFGWHTAVNLPALLANWTAYRQPWVVAAGWLLFAAAGVVAAVRLFHRSRAPAWPLVAVFLSVNAMVSAAAPPDLLFGSANWGWGTIGWFALMIFWERGAAGLIGVLAASSTIALVSVLANGGGNAADLSRYTMYLYGTVILPVALYYGAELLNTLARTRASAAAARATVEAERVAAGHAHRERLLRLRLVGRTAGAVLAELANGRADPTDPAVQRRCAREASRLRRLIAESDDVPDPLLHELRACVDVVERNGLPVEFVTIGNPPPLPVEIRRRLAEPHTATLSTARQWARLTVLAGPEEVVVSVTTPGIAAGTLRTGPATGDDDAVEYTVEQDEDLVWTQTRWRAAPARRQEQETESASPSSTTTRWWWRGSARGSPRSHGWRSWVPARIRTWYSARASGRPT